MILIIDNYDSFTYNLVQYLGELGADLKVYRNDKISIAEVKKLKPERIVEWAGGPLAVVDCFGILDDDRIRRYFELGCEVKALGRGHIQRIKEEVRNA